MLLGSLFALNWHHRLFQPVLVVCGQDSRTLTGPCRLSVRKGRRGSRKADRSIHIALASRISLRFPSMKQLANPTVRCNHSSSPGVPEHEAQHLLSRASKNLTVHHDRNLQLDNFRHDAVGTLQLPSADCIDLKRNTKAGETRYIPCYCRCIVWRCYYSWCGCRIC